MLPFTNSPDTYWSLSFPAFTIGTVGCITLYAIANIAIFAYTPPSAAGTIGAILNCALQLGSAVGIAVITSIQTSVDGADAAAAPRPTTEAEWIYAFRGRAAGYWFIFTVAILEVLSVLVFFHPHAELSDEEQEKEQDREQDRKTMDEG